MRKNLSGFTLIELLVVIAIIALLSTLSVLALNTARIKARDARRLGDINQIRTGLEMYYTDAFSYPPGSLAAGVSLSRGNGFNAVSSGTIYIATVPTNPSPVSDGSCSSTAAYTYAQQSAGSSYTLNYCLSTIGNATATPQSMK